jgi:hypothetical protein
MYNAMFSTEVGDDVYEEDKSVKNNSPNTNSWYILIYTLEDKNIHFIHLFIININAKILYV